MVFWCWCINVELDFEVELTVSAFQVEDKGDDVEEDFIVISAPLNLANVDRKVINKYFYEAIKKRLGYSSNDFVVLKNRAINNLLNSNDNAVGDKILKEFSVEYPEYLI